MVLTIFDDAIRLQSYLSLNGI